MAREPEVKKKDVINITIDLAGIEEENKREKKEV